ncbi:MAG: cytochrome c maturation protein CcmE [Acidimicrobiales bacterium]|jgi:cytochrome c-type biogenesis protein CcmE|nr:cytochrome c maturation protein CcmE [Acidimicrobiales bacterium]MDP6298898.1 cytochrome c maturation protein CcmE [Acidimicrobiales bacterium]HJM27769.1 cytochrome c maturation protein CcmE [Acidimicrobiales bacterium]HJM96713.1 cytochrome c maturation protein CcmE [Acidimicrobiales bacterium]
MPDDNQAMDLSPRRQESKKSPQWLPALTVIVIAGAVIILVWFLVTNSQSFLPADEAVESRLEMGERRFQLLGSPVTNVDDDQTFIIDGNEYTFFSVSFDGILVDVVSQGTPPDLFDEGIPVVLEGKWVQGPLPNPLYVFENGANDGWWFATNRILVKHDNDYREDRIGDAEERGQLPKASES